MTRSRHLQASLRSANGVAQSDPGTARTETATTDTHPSMLASVAAAAEMLAAAGVARADTQRVTVDE